MTPHTHSPQTNHEQNKRTKVKLLALFSLPVFLKSLVVFNTNYDIRLRAGTADDTIERDIPKAKPAHFTGSGTPAFGVASPGFLGRVL